MFVDTLPGAQASTALPDLSSSDSAEAGEFEAVRHLLFGSLIAVQRVVHELHKRQYAEPNDWSKPISTGMPNEVMAILTRQVRVD